MKQKITALLVLAMIWAMAVPAIAASPFGDVDPDHWAYDSVTRLAAAGLIIGYPDGTFGGQRSFTRYEMAMVFARVLDRLEIWIDDQFAGASDQLKADIYDEILAVMDSRLAEVRAEIPEVVEQPVRQVIETTVVEKPFELTDEAKAVLAQFVAERVTEEAAAIAEAAGKKADAAFRLATQNTSNLTQTQAAIAALQGDMDYVKSYIETEVATISADVAALTDEFGGELEVLGFRLDNLESVFFKVYDRVATLQRDVADHAARIEALEAQGEDIDALKTQVAALEADAEELWAADADRNARLAELEVQSTINEIQLYQLKNENTSQDERIERLTARVEELENARLEDLNKQLKAVRFGGYLDNKYTVTEEAAGNNEFVQEAKLEMTVPTDLATLKTSVTVSGSLVEDDDDDTKVGLAVRAQDIDFLSLDWYGELAHSTNVSEAANVDSINFKLGVGKDFEFAGAPLRFDAAKTFDLKKNGTDDNDFTLTFKKFFVDNLSAKVNYGFENNSDAYDWGTGFTLALDPATLKLDFTNAENNEGVVTKTTELGVTVPVLNDAVDLSLKAAQVDKETEDTYMKYTGGIKVKF